MPQVTPSAGQASSKNTRLDNLSPSLSALEIGFPLILLSDDTSQHDIAGFVGSAGSSNWSYDFSDLLIAGALTHSAPSYAAGATPIWRSGGGSDGAVGSTSDAPQVPRPTGVVNNNTSTVTMTTSVNSVTAPTTSTVSTGTGIDSQHYTYSSDEAGQIKNAGYSFVGAYRSTFRSIDTVRGDKLY
jgi:hypothetical protein